MVAKLAPPYRIWCATTRDDPVGGGALRCVLRWTRDAHDLFRTSLVPASTLLERQASVRPSIVAVLGAPHKRLDDVAVGVVRHTPCSVLVVRSKCAPRRVVAIVTSASDALLTRATIISARMFRAPVQVLWLASSMAPSSRPDRSSNARVIRRAEAILGAADTSGVAGPGFGIVAGDEDAVAAATRDDDLLVVGAPLTGHAEEHLAFDLASAARCSVLVVRSSPPRLDGLGGNER